MKTYDKNGYKFLYPDNWMLEETDFDDDEGSITLNSPSGAFWILMVRPFGHNPDELANDALKLMRRQYDRDFEYDRIERTIEDHKLSGYEMNFYYLDLTNTAVVLTFADESRTFAVFWQTGDQMVVTSEKEPFSHEEVFEAITISLLRNI